MQKGRGCFYPAFAAKCDFPRGSAGLGPALHSILVSIFRLAGHQANLRGQCVPVSWHSAAAFGLHPNRPNLGEWLPVLHSLGLMQEYLSAAAIICRKPNPYLVPAKDKDLAAG